MSIGVPEERAKKSRNRILGRFPTLWPWRPAPRKLTVVSTAIHILLVVVGAVALFVCFAEVWRRWYLIPLQADATHFAITDDGWRIAVHHYRGKAGDPVLLCHGLGANGYNMDLGPEHSLARFLADRGLDVWSIELRGHGASCSRMPGSKAKRVWTFDDHALRDVPAAIGLVLAETREKRLHWVGHSMGGMVAFAYLSKTQDPRIASICSMASPTDFSARPARAKALAWALRVLSFLPTMPYHRLAGALIPFYWGYPLSFPTHEGRNTPIRAVRQSIANLIAPVNRGVFGQFALWFGSGRFTNRNGDFDYGEGLAKISVPTCALAGSRDWMLRPEEMRAGLDRLGSRKRVFHEIGRQTGTRHEYGHGDLVIGRNAKTEVFPLIASWIEARQRRPDRSGRTQTNQALARVRQLPPVGNYFDPYSRRLRRRFAAQRAIEVARVG